MKHTVTKQTDEENPLDSLGRKIAQARGQENEPEQVQNTALGKGWRLASELVAALLVAGALGIGLDRLIGTTPLFLLIGLFVGFAAGILNVQRAMKELPSKEGEE